MLRTRDQLITQIGKAEGLFKMLLDKSINWDMDLLHKQIDDWLKTEKESYAHLHKKKE